MQLSIWGEVLKSPQSQREMRWCMKCVSTRMNLSSDTRLLLIRYFTSATRTRVHCCCRELAHGQGSWPLAWLLAARQSRICEGRQTVSSCLIGLSGALTSLIRTSGAQAARISAFDSLLAGISHCAQVYKETITKRMPAQSPGMNDQDVGLAAGWVKQEHEGTFTRVTVADIKPDILQQFQGEEAENVCRQLAHLYHYYLHGPQGNNGSRVHFLNTASELCFLGATFAMPSACPRLSLLQLL